ncbi:M20/M25/M40 family metallo-hydrolase [Wukongibacter baidiensis]|uniref:M20/M25/M40 family metallo-hydrolase n=1 Tax=Wukongibacter baidiensis TaxID=1723361 RepID=UPI003D7FE7A1
MIKYIIKTLVDLLSIDTRTKKNNETEAAIYIKKKLDEYNIWSEIIEPITGKGSVIGYIPGRNKEKRNLLLLSHLDTCYYGNLEDWFMDPRRGTEYEGRVFGRGAIDCKGLVALCMGILVYLKTNNIILERGIVFAGTADEESGGHFGSKYLLSNHHLIKESGYVLSEGGGFPIKVDEGLYYLCQYGERGKLRYCLLEDDGRKLLMDKKRIVGRLDKELIEGSKNLSDSYRLFDSLYQKSTVNHSRRIDYEDIFSNSVSIYMQEEKSILEIDYLPEIKKVSIIDAVRNMYDIELSDNNLIKDVPAYLSNTDTGLYKIIENETSKYLPEAKVIPYITPGYSDNRLFREQGKVTYGYFPMDINNSLSGIHGYNEYISYKSLEIGFQILKNIIMKFCLD